MARVTAKLRAASSPAVARLSTSESRPYETQDDPAPLRIGRRRRRCSPAGRRAAKPTITMSGSTSVAPLVSKLAKAYVKAKPARRKFKLLQGGSDIGVADVSRGRVTIGMSSRDPQPSDPGGLVFNRIARDGDLRRDQPVQPARQPLPGPGPGDLLRPRPQLEPGAGRQGVRARSTCRPERRPPVRRTPSRTSSWGRTCGRAERQPEGSNGLVQQSVRSNKNAIGYVDFDFTAGLQHRPLQGRRVQPAQREVRPVRRRPQLLARDPRRGDGRGRGMMKWIRSAQQGAQDRSPRTGCRSSSGRQPPDRSGYPSAAARRRPHALDGASSAVASDRRAERLLGRARLHASWR